MSLDSKDDTGTKQWPLRGVTLGTISGAIILKLRLSFPGCTAEEKAITLEFNNVDGDRYEAFVKKLKDVVDDFATDEVPF